MTVFASLLVGGTLILQVPPPAPPQSQPMPGAQPGQNQPGQQPGQNQPGQNQPGQPGQNPPGQQPNNPNQPGQQPNQAQPQSIQATPMGQAVPNGQITATITGVDLNRNMMVISQPTGVAGGQTFTRFAVPANAAFRDATNQMLKDRFRSSMFAGSGQLNVAAQVRFNAQGQVSEIRLMPTNQGQQPQGQQPQGQQPQGQQPQQQQTPNQQPSP